jgi:hypothetical protein
MVFYCFATKEYQRWKDPSTKKSCYFRILTVVLPVGASPKVELKVSVLTPPSALGL